MLDDCPNDGGRCGSFFICSAEREEEEAGAAGAAGAGAAGGAGEEAGEAEEEIGTDAPFIRCLITFVCK